MSQIFDALQRAEAERAEDEGSLPQSLDLLRWAERRAASRWEAASVGPESNAARITEGGIGLETEPGAPESAILAAPASAEIFSAEERSALLSSFRSIRISSPTPNRLVCITDRQSPTAEAVRLLGVRLRDIRRIRPLKKLLITSSIPREGKSMIAANLACALADAAEEKVLLVEGDFRLPTQMGIFGFEKEPGICEYLQEDHSFLENIYRIESTDVWIMPAGDAPKNPLEVLESERLPALMEKLAACFDWIVIDSPPVLPLADTSIWMRMADGVLMVTRPGITEKQQLRKGLEALESEKVLGTVLNGTVASAYSSYYYHKSHNV